MMVTGRICAKEKDRGSGFALAARIVVTANHVVRGQEASSLLFVLDDGRRYQVERVEPDEILDVAVLHMAEDVPEVLLVGPAVEGLNWQVESQPLGNDPLLTGTIDATDRRLVNEKGHEIRAVQLWVKQELGDYRGYSGSAVALKSPHDMVFGVLVEQVYLRLVTRAGQHKKPASNVLYAVPILDVLQRFGLTELQQQYQEQHARLGKGTRVPFMAPGLPAHLIDRRDQYGPLLDCVLGADNGSPVATTVALYGSGGFGKTTLAAQLCHDDDVKATFANGILWATLGFSPSVLEELANLYAALTGERPKFINKDDAARELARQLADRADRRCLLVIDDVWDPSHLTPFQRGDDLCTRLITTRLVDVALEANERIPVDEMTLDEATGLLTRYLDAPSSDRKPFEALARRLGEWPLLLELAGSFLKQRLVYGDTVDSALTRLNRRLDEKGMVAFDRRNAQERRQAVARTVSVSLDLLTKEERSQYRALAVFPVDAAVPLEAVSTLLGLSASDTEDLVEALANLSLLKLDLNIGTIHLHDVMRDYLARELDGAPALHARLADAWSAPEQLPDDAYAWRYAAYHMAAALPGTDAQERPRRTKRLVELVTNPTFQEGHRQHVADPPALERDLNRALECAVEDENGEAPLLVIRAALALGALEGLQPEQLFELARGGELERAESLLALFNPDLLWRQAVLLSLAWQAAAAGHSAGALALLTRLKQEISPHDRVLELLLQRVRSAIEPGVAPPPSHLPYAPDRYDVLRILERLGGTTIEPLVSEHPDLQQQTDLQQMGDEAPTYLAEKDGPLLVAFAAVNPEHHTTYLKRYIALQASNSYQHYRNRSLWLLIPPIVRHPNPAWILDILRELMIGALAQTSIDFQSALPLAVQGLRARQGDATALLALEDDAKDTLERVRTLSSRRGEGDPWAHELRRLAALAEVYFRVLNRPAEANQLLNKALGLHFSYNFAGFRAPACLTLAESLRLCGRDEPQMIKSAVQNALKAAHNIHDPEFCAQTTARINAMQARWWPAAPDTIDIASTIARFTQDPQKPPFLPLHRVGDKYQHRAAVSDRLPLPPGMLMAQTVQEITQVYPSMRLESEEEILALNPELQGLADQALPEGTQINIIDPDFAPLLAARLAAEALAAGGLRDSERASMIQRLVPLSVANRTALDTVAARLVMASSPQDLAALQSLYGGEKDRARNLSKE
jgi:hypothetical protein